MTAKQYKENLKIYVDNLRFEIKQLERGEKTAVKKGNKELAYGYSLKAYTLAHVIRSIEEIIK